MVQLSTTSRALCDLALSFQIHRQDAMSAGERKECISIRTTLQASSALHYRAIRCSQSPEQALPFRQDRWHATLVRESNAALATPLGERILLIIFKYLALRVGGDRRLRVVIG